MIIFVDISEKLIYYDDDIRFHDITERKGEKKMISIEKMVEITTEFDRYWGLDHDLYYTDTHFDEYKTAKREFIRNAMKPRAHKIIEKIFLRMIRKEEWDKRWSLIAEDIAYEYEIDICYDHEHGSIGIDDNEIYFDPKVFEEDFGY